MFVSLRGGLFDGGDYLSQITSAESVFIFSPQIKRSQRYLSSYLCKDARYIKLSKLQVRKKANPSETQKHNRSTPVLLQRLFLQKTCKQYLINFRVIYIIDISEQPGNKFNYKKKKHMALHGRMRTGKLLCFKLQHQLEIVRLRLSISLSETNLWPGHSFELSI